MYQSYPELNFPSFQFKIKTEKETSMIWDMVRNKWIELTPEEWVRQHIVHYFIEVLAYPKGLTQIECQIIVGKLKKRFDLVVMDRQLKPWLIVECKAPHIKIDNEVLQQAGNYNSQLKSPYLSVSNGLQHYCFKIDFEKGNFKTIPHFPVYES